VLLLLWCETAGRSVGVRGRATERVLGIHSGERSGRGAVIRALRGEARGPLLLRSGDVLRRNVV